MGKPESIYMWGNLEKAIQRSESRIELINKTTDLYDPQYFSKNNKYCSLIFSHIIGEFVQMKKPHDFMYGFKSQCTSINELLYKLEGCVHSRQKSKSKTFPQIGNEFLPPSKISP